MDNSELITTITKKNAIARYIQGIADQRLPVRIACGEDEDSRIYRTQIARIAQDQDQIVIHQPRPADWHKHISDEDSVFISCRMPNGTICFNGSLSLLEGNANSPYCQLSFPRELSKKQLRSNFRVSVLKYGSCIEMTVPGSPDRHKGICNDISLGGLLVHLPHCDLPLKKGDEVRDIHLHVPGIIDLRCVAKICRITEIEGRGLFMGLNFESLSARQTNDLRAALIKLERQNIKTDPL